MLTRKEIIFLLKTLQDNYIKRKEVGTLYEKWDRMPYELIEIYLNYVTKPQFDIVYDDYANKYIYNESRVENNVTEEERKGLGAVYDYLQAFDINHDYFNVFVTSLTIHNKLYSYCAPGFGGKLRESEVVMFDTHVDIPSASEVRYLFNRLIPLANYPFSYLENGDVFNYINQCIILITDLIRMQPFQDGNKRTFRALLNLLLKKIEIPPIYITVEERIEYKYALIEALEKREYHRIIQFYYYKICDEIMALNPEKSVLSEDGRAYMKIYNTKNGTLC